MSTINQIIKKHMTPMAIVKHMIPMSIVKLMIKKYHSHSINDPLKLFYDSLFNDFFNQKNIRIKSSSASIKNHAGRNNTSLK